MSLSSLCPETANEQRESLFLQKVPCEVITRVLQQCILAFDDYSYKTTCKDLAEVLTLGTICRSLRQLVYSTPALWATVTFRPQPSDRFDYISEWLGRTGSVQLALRVDTNSAMQGYKASWFPDDDEDSSDDDEDGGYDKGDRVARVKEKQAQLSTLLSTIRPYLSKCARLHLSIGCIVPELLLDDPSRFPLLKTLNLVVRDKFLGQYKDNPLGLANSPDVAPNIEEVRLEGPFMSLTRLPWSNIVDLELVRVYISECAVVVSQTPALRYLVVIDVKNRPIDEYADTDEDEAPTPDGRRSIITLPYLVSLDWQSIVHPKISRFFDRLSTPSLTHFRYYPYLPCIGYPLGIFAPFLRQAAPSLSVIIAKNIEKDDLHYFRSLAPNTAAVLIDGLSEIMKRPPRLDSSILSLYDNPAGRERDEVEYFIPASAEVTAPMPNQLREQPFSLRTFLQML